MSRYQYKIVYWSHEGKFLGQSIQPEHAVVIPTDEQLQEAIKIVSRQAKVDWHLTMADVYRNDILQRIVFPTWVWNFADGSLFSKT